MIAFYSVLDAFNSFRPVFLLFHYARITRIGIFLCGLSAVFSVHTIRDVEKKQTIFTIVYTAFYCKKISPLLRALQHNENTVLDDLQVLDFKSFAIYEEHYDILYRRVVWLRRR